MANLNPWGESRQWSDGIPPEIHPGDVQVLTALLGHVMRPGVVAVEVGSWVGNGSTRVLSEVLRPAGGKLYCVDTWAGSDNVEHHLKFREQYGSMFRVFARNVWRYAGQGVVRPLALPSTEASRLFPDGSVDLVFIDGNHGYSAVKEDIAAWLPKVRSGGILCGHDCDASYADLVPQLRREMAARREEDAFTNTRHPGPPAFHAGVVTAVHEFFGRSATLWFRHNPASTVWSYNVKRPLLARLAGRLGLGRCELPGAGATGRADAAVAPWPAGLPDEADGRLLVAGSPGDSAPWR
jgi:predicted O-methyltransferase YrrM